MRSESKGSNKVFFFDLDETLVHTNRANYLSYAKAIEEVIGETMAYDYSAIEERFNRQVLKKLFPKLPINAYRKIIKNKERYFSSFLSETSPVYNNVKLLQSVYRSHSTILVSNSHELRAMKTLCYHGLLQYFDGFYCKDTAMREPSLLKQNNKYLEALLYFDLSADNIIVFEDDPKEIEKARLAQIKTINPILLQ